MALCAKEEWRAVPGYEGYYEVSDYGRVRSVARQIMRNGVPMEISGQIRKPAPRSRGNSFQVDLFRDGGKWAVAPGRLVYLAFIGPVESTQRIYHRNGDSQDDRPENLTTKAPACVARQIPPEQLSYATAHHRVLWTWGPAKQYPCIECGNPAKDWAYDGTDPTQLYGPVKGDGSTWCLFSAYPEFYMPMCRPCHRRRDDGYAAQELHEYRLWKIANPGCVLSVEAV